jgi:hypothetical protein
VGTVSPQTYGLKSRSRFGNLQGIDTPDGNNVSTVLADLKHTQMESKEKEVGPMEAKRPLLYMYRTAVMLSDWEIYLLTEGLNAIIEKREKDLRDGIIESDGMAHFDEMKAHREQLLAKLKTIKVL